MTMQHTPGTEGYVRDTKKFIDATLEVDFWTLHRDFVKYIPKKPSRVLDVGAGIGRDASVFSDLGHTVVAVEPLEEFRCVGKKMFAQANINWVNDSLPTLKLLDDQPYPFDFILSSGVWHHLNQEEQYHSMKRIAQLLRLEGVFALSLRHGPAGVGTHVFATNGEQAIMHAEHFGLQTLLLLENQPSLMRNKEMVFWTKLVFQKCE